MEQETILDRFTAEEKAGAFDSIAAHYFNRNFGSMSKANLDVLLFSIYYELCKKHGVNTDDYAMSQALGISQTRIRTLKQNKQLQYPFSEEEFNWKEQFAELVPYARFDNKTGLVKMTISDVNVLSELRNFLESHHMYDEYQLNPKLFQCELEYFLELCALLGNENVTIDAKAEKRLKKLSEKAPDDAVQAAIGDILDGNWKGGFKNLALSAVPEVLVEAVDSIPFSGLAKRLITGLCAAIRSKYGF